MFIKEVKMVKTIKLNDNEICMVIGALGYLNDIHKKDNQIEELKDKISKQYIDELKREVSSN